LFEGFGFLWETEIGAGTAWQEKQIAVDIFSTDFADSRGVALSICPILAVFRL
jgi:hypothetical protein